MQDFGPTFSTTGEVIVTVTDFNDHNPQFELDSYNTHVYENLTVVSTAAMLFHQCTHMIHYFL